MNFKIGEGFKVEADQASIDLARQSDDVVRAAREEAQRVGDERGLWLPAEAARLAVASDAEVPEGLRDQLLSTAGEGAGLFIAAISGINANRRKTARIPLLKPGEYRERFEDQLPDNLLKASTLLPATANRPRILIPALNYSLSREEVVEAVGAASDRGLWSWSGRMDFLRNFPTDALSGFDPNADPEDIKPQVVPTVYDKAREGTVAKQNEGLKALQAEAPEIHVSPIFMTAVLGHRYKGQDRSWQDTYTRGIDQEPAEVAGNDCVPDADVNGVGDGNVGASDVQGDNAARLLARS